jgi:acetyl esterase
LIRPGEPIPIGKVEDREIEGGDGQPMAVRVYTPEGSGPFPGALWIRGGSFTRTTLDQLDPLRRATAKATGCVIVAVDQRLSPEARYPAPLEDADAAAGWLFENAAALGIKPGCIGVAGESSGGNLAASLAMRSRDRGSRAFAFQLLYAPLTDASLSCPSVEEFAEGYVLTRRQLVWAYEQYAPGVDRADPGISPVLAPDLTGMPPTVVVTIEYDPVRDEGERWVGRLREAGVVVKHERIGGGVHHFGGPEAQPTFLRLINELLKEIGAR